MDSRDPLGDFLDSLCVDWGFCLRPDAKDAVRSAASESPELFAAAVLIAEGLTPEYEKAWRKRIASRFRERFGEHWMTPS